MGRFSAHADSALDPIGGGNLVGAPDHGPRTTELCVQNPGGDGRMKIATGRSRPRGTAGRKLYGAVARSNAMVARHTPMSRQGTTWRQRPAPGVRMKETNVADSLGFPRVSMQMDRYCLAGAEKGCFIQ